MVDKFMEAEHKSGQRHQTAVVVTVFFLAIASYLTTTTTTTKPVSLKNVLDEAIQMINFIKCQPLSTFLKSIL